MIWGYQHFRKPHEKSLSDEDWVRSQVWPLTRHYRWLPRVEITAFLEAQWWDQDPKNSPYYWAFNGRAHCSGWTLLSQARRSMSSVPLHSGPAEGSQGLESERLRIFVRNRPSNKEKEKTHDWKNTSYFEAGAARDVAIPKWSAQFVDAWRPYPLWQDSIWIQYWHVSLPHGTFIFYNLFSILLFR